MSYFKQQLIASLEGVDTQVSLEESMEAAYQVSHILNEIENETTSMERCESILKELTMQNVAIESIVNANGKLTESEAGAFEAARRSAAIALGLSVDSYGGKKLIDNVGLESMVTNKYQVSLEGVKEIIAKIKETLKKIWEWMVKKFKQLALFLRKSIAHRSEQFEKLYQAIYLMSDKEFDDAVESVEGRVNYGTLDEHGKMNSVTKAVSEINAFLSKINKANNSAVQLVVDAIKYTINRQDDSESASQSFQEKSREVIDSYKNIGETVIEFGNKKLEFDPKMMVEAIIDGDSHPFKSASTGPRGAKSNKPLNMSRKEMLDVLNVYKTIDKDIETISKNIEDNTNRMFKFNKLINTTLDANKNNDKINHAEILKYIGVYRNITSFTASILREFANHFDEYIVNIPRTVNAIVNASNKLKSGEE